jgi:Fe-S-cluster containining protein
LEVTLTEPRTGPSTYRALLQRLSDWFEEGRRRAPGVIPCRRGCTACCHGPFDISVADVELLQEAVDRLPEETRLDVIMRARVLLAKMEAREPGWTAPHAIADLGEERFDQLAAALGAEPCPLLSDDGRCRVYEDRPLVCRLIGLAMVSPTGREIPNACPIQEHFPGYPSLPPVPFDLEDLELAEIECLRGAARRLLGDASRHDYETTIAAALADLDDQRATRSAIR